MKSAFWTNCSLNLHATQPMLIYFDKPSDAVCFARGLLGWRYASGLRQMWNNLLRRSYRIKTWNKVSLSGSVLNKPLLKFARCFLNLIDHWLICSTLPRNWCMFQDPSFKGKDKVSNTRKVKVSHPNAGSGWVKHSLVWFFMWIDQTSVYSLFFE